MDTQLIVIPPSVVGEFNAMTCLLAAFRRTDNTDDRCGSLEYVYLSTCTSIISAAFQDLYHSLLDLVLFLLLDCHLVLYNSTELKNLCDYRRRF